jgi:hypothetical protein
VVKLTTLLGNRASLNKINYFACGESIFDLPKIIPRLEYPKHSTP